MCNTLQKAAENYTDLYKCIVNPELPMIKYSQLQRTDSHKSGVKVLRPSLLLLVFVVWLEALAREHKLSDTNALD